MKASEALFPVPPSAGLRCTTSSLSESWCLTSSSRLLPLWARSAETESETGPGTSSAPEAALGASCRRSRDGSQTSPAGSALQLCPAAAPPGWGTARSWTRQNTGSGPGCPLLATGSTPPLSPEPSGSEPAPPGRPGCSAPSAGSEPRAEAPSCSAPASSTGRLRRWSLGCRAESRGGKPTLRQRRLCPAGSAAPRDAVGQLCREEKEAKCQKNVQKESLNSH